MDKNFEEVKKIIKDHDPEFAKDEIDLDTLAWQICQLFEPKPEPIYTLNCDKCGKPFESLEAFPNPQLCPLCFEPKPDVIRFQPTEFTNLSDEENRGRF